MFKFIVLSAAIIACASAIYAPVAHGAYGVSPIHAAGYGYGASPYAGYGLAAPIHAAGYHGAAIAAPVYPGYHGAYSSPIHAGYSPIVKTAAIAHHPIATSYSNSVAHHSAYPAYSHGAYAAPIASAYSYGGGYNGYSSSGYGLAPVAKVIAPAYAGYAHGPSSYYHH